MTFAVGRAVLAFGTAAGLVFPLGTGAGVDFEAFEEAELLYFFPPLEAYSALLSSSSSSSESLELSSDSLLFLFFASSLSVFDEESLAGFVVVDLLAELESFLPVFVVVCGLALMLPLPALLRLALESPWSCCCC